MTVKRRGALIPLVFGLVGALVAGTAGADDYTSDLKHDLMSPFCPGRTLASCPSPQAGELIEWISEQEAAGVPEEAVVEKLIADFGEEILGAPPAEGITLWAYVFPVAGFLAGGGVVVVALRRIVNRRDDEDDAQRAGTTDRAPAADQHPFEAPAPGDEELAALVDAELAGRR